MKNHKHLRGSESQTLVSELVSKELKTLKKAEKTEKDKDQVLMSQIMHVLTEAQLSSK